MTKPKTKRKPYWEMNTEELAEATKEFDKTIPLNHTKPLSKEKREQLERWRRGPAINIFAKSGKKKEVTVTLDEELVQRCQVIASRHRLTLSQLVNFTLSNAIQFAD